MSQPQFTVKSFARGVKLTVQHAWTPAQQIQSAAQSSAVEGQQVLAPTRMSWTFTPDSETFGSTHGAKVVLPMILPPLVAGVVVPAAVVVLVLLVPRFRGSATAAFAAGLLAGFVALVAVAVNVTVWVQIGRAHV